MEPSFPTDYKVIIEKIDRIDPIKYGTNRNYINGAVTYLSPYISRGVISTKQILLSVLAKGYTFNAIEPFVKELCWRDYFQRIQQTRDIDQEIKQKQRIVLNNGIPVNIINAATGITGIDKAIEQLYQFGYMHNHCRMYTAFLTCNIARSNWLHPAQWMYYHLLDGDWASNACSWQWVAGTNSNKNYIANQENINRYTFTNQKNTFLDKSYESIDSMEVPDVLAETKKIAFELELPHALDIQINKALPTFIYNYYNLDPLWHRDEVGNRILLIEKTLFNKYPVSKKCIAFMMALSQNIPGIQVYLGSFTSLLNHLKNKNIFYKEHPFNKDYQGIEEEREWIVNEVTGYHPSFFSFWKKIEKSLKK